MVRAIILARRCKLVIIEQGCLPMRFSVHPRLRLLPCLPRPSRLKIGIVGFGTFGQFLAKRMVQAGHEVSAAQ